MKIIRYIVVIHFLIANFVYLKIENDKYKYYISILYQGLPIQIVVWVELV